MLWILAGVLVFFVWWPAGAVLFVIGLLSFVDKANKRHKELIEALNSQRSVR